jgi:hypothetical protein
MCSIVDPDPQATHIIVVKAVTEFTHFTEYNKTIMDITVFTIVDNTDVFRITESMT